MVCGVWCVVCGFGLGFCGSGFCGLWLGVLWFGVLGCVVRGVWRGVGLGARHRHVRAPVAEHLPNMKRELD